MPAQPSHGWTKKAWFRPQDFDWPNDLLPPPTYYPPPLGPPTKPVPTTPYGVVGPGHRLFGRPKAGSKAFLTWIFLKKPSFHQRNLFKIDRRHYPEHQTNTKSHFKGQKVSWKGSGGLHPGTRRGDLLPLTGTYYPTPPTTPPLGAPTIPDHTTP